MKRKIIYRREMRQLEKEFHKFIEEEKTEEDKRKKMEGIDRVLQKRRELLEQKQN